jgi:hypothetical protein
MRTRVWWRPIVASVSGSAGRFRIEKAAFSATVCAWQGGQCQGRADHAGKVGQATFERAGEEQELGLSSKGWWEVLQSSAECNGLVSAILHVHGDVIMGTNRGTGGNEPVSGMLDIMHAR